MPLPNFTDRRTKQQADADQQCADVLSDLRWFPNQLRSLTQHLISQHCNMNTYACDTVAQSLLMVSPIGVSWNVTTNGKLCLFCRKTLSGKIVPEHLIPDSIGGWLTTFDICNPCNHLLGTSVDRFVDDPMIVELRKEAGLKVRVSIKAHTAPA